MHAPLALGVDLGTGSARAFLFDAAGERHGGVRLPYEWRLDTDGAVETDADALVQLVHAAIDGALLHAPADAAIAAVGFSTLWHTILGIDSRGNAVTPAIAWNDTRATDAARRLRARVDADAYHARTGAMLHPSYPPARILWLRETLADSPRVHRWLSVPEFIWLRLTGRHDVDVSIAAGSGMLHRDSLTWDADILAAIGVEETQLGRIVADDAAVLAGSDVAATRRWPRLREALWRAPVGDGACANVGSGCTSAERVALSIGTSAALRVIVPRARSTPPQGLWSYPLGRGSALLGGATTNGGLVPSWMRRTLALPADDAELDALLLARIPAAHGLRALPWLAGERSPDWPLDVTGSIHGLRAATSALDILQAGMEAVAYRVANVRTRLCAAVPEGRTIIASGGALLRSAYWPKLLADVMGERVHICTDVETSSRGAAMLALLAAGEFDEVGEMPAPASVIIEPDAGAHALHTRARERHARDRA